MKKLYYSMDNRDQMDDFLDDWVNTQMEKTPLYGFGMVMVKDGQVTFIKSYGSDPITGRVFDAEKSTFRVASVAKLFTATAIIQTSDRGKIRLTDDVNQHLTAFKLDDSFNQPVTFHHLLTHTEGFERWVIGIRPPTPDTFVSLEEFYTAHQARRIYPPGKQMTYDNYASGLLGLLIEDISGISFTDYMSQNVFAPLGMNSSTFVQPPPENIQARLVREYEYDDKTGKYNEMPDRVSILSSAGGLHTSLADMGHFLIAITGDGSYEGQAILSREAVQAMYVQRFTAHPQMPGMTYGLFEEFPNGRRVLRRDGDSLNAWSRVYLLPDEQAGFFFIAIGDENSRVEFAQAFFDAFYQSVSQPDTHASSTDLQQYEGVYHHVQQSRSTFVKSLDLFTGNLRVSQNDRNGLDVQVIDMGDSFGGFEGTTQWQEMDENFFQREDGHGQLAFGQDEQGNVYLYSGQRYMGAYIKLHWYQTPSFHFSLMIVFAVVFLSAIPLAWKLPFKFEAFLLGGAGVLGALFIFLWIPGIYVIGATGGEPSFANGVNGLTRFILTLPILVAALLPVLGFLLWRIFSRGTVPLHQQIHYAVIIVFLVLFLAWAHGWNLLGYRY